MGGTGVAREAIDEAEPAAAIGKPRSERSQLHQISRTGDVKGVLPENKGDLDGGPGTSMAMLYFYDRQGIKSPLEDFKWHQTRLRTYLENNIALGG